MHFGGPLNILTEKIVFISSHMFAAKRRSTHILQLFVADVK